MTNNQDYPCIHLDKEHFCFLNCSGVSFSLLIVSSHGFDLPVYWIVAPDLDVYANHVSCSIFTGSLPGIISRQDHKYVESKSELYNNVEQVSGS